MVIRQAALAWLMMAVPVTVWGETVILQLQVLEGEGGVFAASSRALKPLTVRVTDEAGAPVPGAAVSFRLPEDGVSGVFQNGLKTDLVLSGPDGRATSPTIAWGPLAGPVRIRVTAALEQVRAGVLVAAYVAAAGNVMAVGASSSNAIAPQQQRVSSPTAAPTQRLKKRSWAMWIAVAAIGIGGGVAVALLRHPRTGSPSSSASPPIISIGQPTISVGR